MQRHARRNLGVVLGLCLVLGAMVTLVSFSVPLYRLFCAATGFGGTTQRVDSDQAKISERTVTVRFNTDVAPGLPGRFVRSRSRSRCISARRRWCSCRQKTAATSPLSGMRIST